MGGNKVPTGEGFFPVDPLEKGDEEANLVDSYLQERVERPPLLRRSAESSFNRDLGVSVSCVPARQTDRDRIAGKGRGRHPC